MAIEATERWTDARLVALAGALALPCPVRESFLFDPDHAFRVSLTESDATLQRAIKRVFDHAGLPCDATVVLWKAGLAAPKVERDGNTWFLELDPALQKTQAALAATVGREAGRALLADRGTPLSRSSVDAADAELAAILAGVGALLVLPDAPRGALHPRLVRYAFARVAASLGVGLRRTRDVVPSITWLWLRASRRPLPYRALDTHVVIRCFCARRLRVPTGAIGATTCPSCKRKRPFDGRACRISALAAPRPLPTIPVPVATPLHRAWSWFVDMPLAARLLVLVLAIAVATTFALR